MAVCSNVEHCRELAAEVVRRLDSPPSNGTSQEAPAGPAEPLGRWRKKRRPNAVKVIIEHGALAAGASLTLHMVLAPERQALAGWLAEDPRRSQATWANHRTKPLVWQADGKHYSPSGLIAHMWELAGWEARPVANQGTVRWRTAEGDTLAALAARLLGELEE